MKLGENSPFLASLQEAERHVVRFPDCVRADREVTDLARAFRTVRQLEDMNRNREKQ